MRDPLVAIRIRLLLMAALAAAPPMRAQVTPETQTAPAPQTSQSETATIAIVPLDSKNPGGAATVTGALQVSKGKAFITGNGEVTSGSDTTQVTLPRRGVLRVCATTTVRLAADPSVPSGETPGLLLAMDHGAIEASFATGRNSDILLTPDFRILIGGPGAAEVKVRLGQHGDTCVDNAGAGSDVQKEPAAPLAAQDGPYVLVSSVFEGGAYRVQPGQRVMFEHGSLREVVDQEKEPCGCPPPLPKDNEFPLAQSEGLALVPPPPAPEHPSVPAPTAGALVYNGAEHAPQTAQAAPPDAAHAAAADSQATKKKRGFFSGVGRFFRRVFGADQQ